MGKMTLDELRALRAEQKTKLSRRSVRNTDVEVIVGMGTCGIAAGAKETLDAFIRELDENGIKTVRVTQTGCMGLCYVEPTVEVVVPGMPDVIYGRVNPGVAGKIVRKHIMNKTLVNDHIYDRPAADIVDEGRAN